MADVDSDELMAAMSRLSGSINNLIAMFKTAAENMVSEPDSSKILSQKLDKMIEQNEEIAKSLILLLDLEKEHLPLITHNTRQAAEIRTPVQRHVSFNRPRQLTPVRNMQINPGTFSPARPSGISSMPNRRFMPPPEMQAPLSEPPEKTLPPDLELDLPEFEAGQQKRRLFGK